MSCQASVWSTHAINTTSALIVSRMFQPLLQARLTGNPLEFLKAQAPGHTKKKILLQNPKTVQSGGTTTPQGQTTTLVSDTRGPAKYKNHCPGVTCSVGLSPASLRGCSLSFRVPEQRSQGAGQHPTGLLVSHLCNAYAPGAVRQTCAEVKCQYRTFYICFLVSHEGRGAKR